MTPPRTPPTADAGRAEDAAFRAIFDAEFRFVWNTLRYLGVREADLQDVSQEVFLTVYRRLGAGEEPRSVRAWLSAIGYHAASNYRRLARHRREVVDDSSDPADPAPDAERRLEEHEDRERLVRALDALELDRRAVLVMHDIDELTMPEVAEAIGIPLNTAYSRLRLARRDLVAAARRVGLRESG